MSTTRKISLSLTCALALMAALTGCGSSSSDNSADGGSPTTYQYLAKPSSAAGLPSGFLPSIAAQLESDGKITFVGYVGVQRYSAAQDALVQPPFRLTFRFFDPVSHAVYGVQTTVRGAPRTTDSLDGTSDKNGVWYYPINYSTGLVIAPGTNVQVEILDDGDRTPGTGDELTLNHIRFWVGAPLVEADNAQPITVTTIAVPGAG